jgi:PAS domain S-box-containing protein
LLNIADFLDLVTRIVMALVALLALADFLRHRGRVRLDVALMLASLGIPMLRQFFPDEVSDLRWVSTPSSMIVVAQPYLLLRLVEDFRPVPRTYIGAAIAGMVLSWVALAAYGYAPPRPQSVTLIIIAYFILVEGYATFAFVRGMLATRGPTRWRLGFAAGGSGLLAVAILLAGIAILAPGASGATATLRPLLTALTAVSYYLGFTPSMWLTRTWQLPELHRFLQDIAGVSAAERSTKTALSLCQAASRVTGGLASAVFLWDEEQQQLKVEVAEVAALRSGSLSPAEGATGQVWTEQRPAAVRVQSTLGREENQMAALVGAKSLLVVPIRSAQRAWGLLLVFHIRGSLFPSDDLSLLSILGEQYALALDYKEAEKALQDREERLRSLLNSTPDGIVIVDSDAHIQLVNVQTERLFGYRRQELLGQPVEILLPERLAAGHVQLRSGYIANPTLRPMGTGLETIGRHKDGSEFPVDISLSPFETADGLLVISTIRDTTERKQVERALQEREERFRSLLNSTPDAIVIVDNDARIQLVNSQTERMFGYRRQELQDQLVEMLLPERLAGGHVQLRSQYIANPTVRPMGTGLETIGRRKDGSEFPVDISLSPLETENGLLVISAIRDTTERKRAEDERARLAAIVDSSEDAIIGKTLEGIIISWNKGAERIYGYSAEEVTGRPGGFLAPPDRPDEVPEMLRRAGHGETVDHFDTQRVRKDGALIDVSLTVSPVRDSSGKVVGSSSIAHDITNRKQAEEALAESEERFRSLVQSASGAIIIADEEGSIISWNRGARDIFGYAEEEVLGRPITQLMPERYREDHRRGLERVRTTGEGHLLGKTVELYGLGKDGNEFPVQISLSSWQTEGRVFFSGILQDISARKELESALQTTNQELEQRVHQLNQANTDLERFAYIASHDLQEPLRMVSGFSQMLKEKYQGQLDADADEYIWYLVDAAGRMRDLINDLLNFSRVQTRGKSLEMVSCEEVLGWAMSNLRGAIEEARAVVTHDPLPEVMGDANQLMVVFQNLLANAIKFRNLDPPRVHISAQASDEELIFSVKDNGIGIEPDFYERIFEIFQRLHTRDRYPGTGIGLAICHRIIERHGGRIWVESEPGQGSTFYFSLPTPAGTNNEV